MNNTGIITGITGTTDDTSNTDGWAVLPPADLDHMPVEVATELLASPKARLTARMRKNCLAARQRVYCSATPLRRFADRWHQNTANEARFVNERPLVNLARLSLLPLARLDRLARRTSRRRIALQRAYERAQQSLLPAVFAKLRVSLELKAAALDATADAARDELNRRRHGRVMVG
jgi:hypothetical protein